MLIFVQRCYSTTKTLGKKAKDISVGFKYSDDSVITVKGAEGDSLLDLVIDNNIGQPHYGHPVIIAQMALALVIKR